MAMSTITIEELKALEESSTENEWNTNCDSIKDAHGGFPVDWFPRVVLSGLLERTAAKWGGDGRIKIATC